MRIDFREERIMEAKSPLEVVFPNKKSRTAAEIFLKWLRNRDLRASKAAVSRFADELDAGKLMKGNSPFKYSRRNFYLTVLRTLLDMGFLQRNLPIWDERLRKTVYVYRMNMLDIPHKPPAVGFWRLAYYVSRKWNDLLLQEMAESRTEPPVPLATMKV